jgi:hypothetical protein
MRVSFQMLPEQPAAELLEALAAADRLGYHACYSADEIYHKDAWLLFGAAAQRTERIRLGPQLTLRRGEAIHGTIDAEHDCFGRGHDLASRFLLGGA